MSNWFLDYFTSAVTSRIFPPKKLNACKKSDNALKYSGQLFGRYTRFAIMLTYDSLMRRNKLVDVSYDEFESNMLWMLSVIVDVENEPWEWTLANKTSGAYGYFQILNVDWFQTSLNRMNNQIEAAAKYNNRDWYMPKFEFKLPLAMEQIQRDLDEKKTKEYIIDVRNPDLISALVVSHIAEASGTDEALIGLQTNPVDSAKIAYYRGHHLDATLINKSNAQLLNGKAFSSKNKSVYTNVESKIKCL